MPRAGRLTTRLDADIHYLDPGEFEALLVAKPGERATTSAKLWALDRTLYLTAAMTGLRQGEPDYAPSSDADQIKRDLG